MRFFVCGKMPSGRRRATRLSASPLGLFFVLLENNILERSKLFRGFFGMPNINTY
jgi:hypothetical protein